MGPAPARSVLLSTQSRSAGEVLTLGPPDGDGQAALSAQITATTQPYPMEKATTLFLTFRADRQAGFHHLCQGEVGGPSSLLQDTMLPQAAFCLWPA